MFEAQRWHNDPRLFSLMIVLNSGKHLHLLVLYFTSEDAKQAFDSKVWDAKRLLAPRRYPPLDNRELIR